MVDLALNSSIFLGNGSNDNIGDKTKNPLVILFGEITTKAQLHPKIKQLASTLMRSY